jgi:hypothetical protein
VAYGPALNFPSAPHAPQPRELAFVEMQVVPLSVLPGTRLAALGYTGHGHDREVRSAGGYHLTLSGFPDLRRRGCGSRPGNGSPLPQLLSGREMGAPGM